MVSDLGVIGEWWMADKLESVIETWNSAWLSKDVNAVEMIAADDYIYVGPEGQVLDRAAIVEIIRSPGYRLVSGTWSETSISQLGGDTAVVMDRFRGEGEYRGRVFNEDNRCTAVWVRRSDRWQVRLEHCSAIAGGEPDP